MLTDELLDQPQELLIREEILPVIPGGIVTSTDMYAQTAGALGGFCQNGFTSLRDGRLEGEEIDDFLFVFQEEVVPAGLPSYNSDVPAIQHFLLLSRDICSLLIKLQRRH